MRHARIIAAIAASALALAACGSSSKSPAAGPGTTNNSGTAGLSVPTAGMAPLTSIGKGEGALNLIAWDGYTEPDWVKPFETQTGCKVPRARWFR